MLTGRKAFEGKTRASLLGAILKDEPPRISKVQPIAPPALDRIVADVPREGSRRSLADRARSQARVAVGRVRRPTSRPNVDAGDIDSARAQRRGALPLVATAIASAAIVGGAVWALTRPVVVSPPAVHLQAPPNPGVSLWIDNIAPDVAISPDGSTSPTPAAPGNRSCTCDR